MYNGATETIQNFTPPMLTISSERSLGERWSSFVPRISLVRPIARDIGNPCMKMRAFGRLPDRFPAPVRNNLATIRSRRPNLAKGGMEPIRLSPVTSNEFQAPGPRVMVRVRPGEIGLAERPEAPSVKAPTYRAAVLFFILAAVAFVPFILAPVNGSVSGTAGSADHANGLVSAGPRPLSGGMVVSSDPRVVRNATNLIGDGTFDAIPGPWIYTSGTTGAVTASRDPTARARLGHTTPVLRFDSMDDVFGATPWTSVVSNQQSSSNLSQETAIRTEGNGSLKDGEEIARSNQWARATP